jgi:hypothetical protein
MQPAAEEPHPQAARRSRWGSLRLFCDIILSKVHDAKSTLLEYGIDNLSRFIAKNTLGTVPIYIYSL